MEDDEESFVIEIGFEDDVEYGFDEVVDESDRIRKGFDIVDYETRDD